MENAIRETNRRRAIQMKYNEEHGITPQTIVKDVRNVLEITTREDKKRPGKQLTRIEKQMEIEKLTKEMRAAAQLLEFEHAAYLRDKIAKLKES